MARATRNYRAMIDAIDAITYSMEEYEYQETVEFLNDDLATFPMRSFVHAEHLATRTREDAGGMIS